MKGFTDLEQAKKLVKIVPLESADMHLINKIHAGCVPYNEIIKDTNPYIKAVSLYPYWSLAALMNVLPYPHLEQNYKGKWCCRTEYADTTYLWEADNPVDACYEMILKLHEQKLL